MVKPLAPIVNGMDGQIVRHIGKHARQAVATAFEMNGGVQAFADWAAANPDDFYTKLFPKIITREVDDAQEASIEARLEKIRELPPPRAGQLAPPTDLKLNSETGVYEPVDTQSEDDAQS